VKSLIRKVFILRVEMSNELVEVLITVPFSESTLDTWRSISPRLKINNQVTRRVEDIPLDVWKRVEVLYTDVVLPDPALVPVLHWLQFHFAGIDFLVDAPLVQQALVKVTTLSGAAAPQLAEYAVTMMLALGHHMPDILKNQSRMEWPHDRGERFGPLELRGSTVGIVGYGSIGREIARLLQPFGVTILATKRDVMHPEDSDYTPAGLGDPQGNRFNRLYPVQALKSMLKLCDFVVVCVPFTKETRNMIQKDELAAMKQGSYLINIGRGGVVDQTALQDAIQDHHLAGAALDVFSEEPLPPNNPLWRIPNVIITPHIGGISDLYKDRAAVLFSENLKRYLEGLPLLNYFDTDRGY
jgi:phosphoglycerate dehydrogenase-like enzyme